MSQNELPKNYDPTEVEGRWYDHWVSRGYFRPGDGTEPPFVIMIPPPNVTGSLHFGHAFDHTIQDLLTRWQRMSVVPTLWLPATDHAGIATQNVVEKRLAEQGKTRFDLGRDDFVKEVWKWKEHYQTGDLNSALIRTVNGRTILLQHDVSNPRPYSRLNGVQGTKGIFRDYPAQIYVEGQQGGERFTPIDSWRATHEPALWAKLGDVARSGGHGGMDYVMAWRLVQCMREGLPPDYDVYDAAAWSAPFPLSEMSVAKGSAPVKFPDFTRGEWKQRRAAGPD